MRNLTSRPAKVLLIEDSTADATLLIRSAEMVRVKVDWVHVVRAEEALALLTADVDPLRPDLILLDLNLPGISGHQFLRRFRALEGDLSLTPVIVLTSSTAVIDINESYEGGANAFVEKPIGLEGFGKIVTSIDGFWMELVVLPRSDV